MGLGSILHQSSGRRGTSLCELGFPSAHFTLPLLCHSPHCVVVACLLMWRSEGPWWSCSWLYSQHLAQGLQQAPNKYLLKQGRKKGRREGRREAIEKSNRRVAPVLDEITRFRTVYLTGWQWPPSLSSLWFFCISWFQATPWHMPAAQPLCLWLLAAANLTAQHGNIWEKPEMRY